MNSHPSITWSNYIRFVLNVVLRHLECKSGLYIGLSQFLFTVTRFWSFLIVTHESFCRLLKHIRKFLIATRQSSFPEKHINSKQSEMQSISHYFGKKSEKLYTTVEEPKQNKFFNCLQTFY